MRASFCLRREQGIGALFVGARNVRFSPEMLGGSDICLMFQAGTDLEYLSKHGKDGSYEHVLMGQALRNLSKWALKHSCPRHRVPAALHLG